MTEPPSPQPLIVERIAKLLALLSSDNDGERHNAADALGKLLRQSGTDLVSVATMMLARPNERDTLSDAFDDAFAGFGFDEEAKHRREVDELQACIDRVQAEIAKGPPTTAEMAAQERAALEKAIAAAQVEFAVARSRWTARQEAERKHKQWQQAFARGEIPPKPPDPAKQRRLERKREIARLRRQMARLGAVADKTRAEAEWRYRRSPEYASLASLREQQRLLKELIQMAARGEDVRLPDDLTPDSTASSSRATPA